MKKLCKNKKCRKELPEGYNKPYCQACMNKQVDNTRKGAKGLLGVAGLALVIRAFWKFGDRG